MSLLLRWVVEEVFYFMLLELNTAPWDVIFGNWSTLLEWSFEVYLLSNLFLDEGLNLIALELYDDLSILGTS